MILAAITDWVDNFFWDSVNKFLIAILDRIFYSLMGFLYKVFLVIGSFDLFGGFSSGTDKAMHIYQTFTKRIYSVIGIVVMFILAYQIILFVIDPDKGLKESKKLVTNIVKGIILTVIAPLVFHYLAQIQYHVLVSDNIIWNIVLGEGASSSDNVVEAGNTMASMLFVSVFHPVGTEYSDFYDTSGSLNSPSDACKPYKKAVEDVGDDGYMSQDTLSRSFRNAGLGLIIAGPVGAAIGAIYTWITDEANKTYTCDYYYWILYQAGLKKDEVQDVKPNEVSSITNYSDSTAGYSNKAIYLAPNTPLIDEIYQENHMEYYHFSFIGAIAICFFLVAYTLDISVRVFKLAFLQMIAPVPILLGTIPKNEKLYSSWKDHFIKTYLDVFVRVFVMAFIALMVKLIPAFLKSLVSVFTSTVGGEEASTGMLKAITFFALVLGLLRAGKEIPDMLKDLAKNAGGLLQGIELDPLKSFSKVKEAADYHKANALKASKPLGAISGGIMGGISAGNAVSKSGGSALDRGLATLRGIQTGGKIGMQNGLTKGMLTGAMGKANDIALNDKNERDKRFSQLKNGQFGAMFDELTQGRVKSFTSALKGGTLGLEDRYLYKAGEQYQENANGGKQYFSVAGDAMKSKLSPQIDYAMNNTKNVLTADGRQVLGFSDSNFQLFQGTSLTEIKQQALNQAISSKISENGEDIYSFNGNTYNSEADLRAAINSTITNDAISNVQSTEFRGKTYTNTYNAIEKQLSKEKDNMVKDAEINAFKASLDDQKADGFRAFADSASALDSHYFDSIGPSLQNKISEASKDSLNICSNAFKDMLRNANGGNSIDVNDSRAIMDLIGSDRFINDYNSRSEDMQKEINKDLAIYFHSITKAEDKVAKEISKIKAASNGAKINKYTGVTENILSSDGKKDKK